METKHKDVPHYGHELAGETPATVKRIVQEMVPSKESVPPQEEVEEEVPPTEDSSSDSGASSHTSNSSTAHSECQELTGDQAAALVMGATPEEDVFLSLEDMPPLEEAPPPHFPAARSPPKEEGQT